MVGESSFAGAEILRQLVASCPARFISFRNQRIPYRYLLRALPELKFLSQGCFSAELRTWQSKMQCHNQSIMRGIHMGLFPKKYLRFLTCDTLDTFMCSHHNADLAMALDSYRRFAERIISRIERNPTAPFWGISGAMVITRKHWLEYCDHVEILVGLVRGDNFRPDLPPKSQPENVVASTDRRPDFPQICAAAERLTTSFRRAACLLSLC